MNGARMNGYVRELALAAREAQSAIAACDAATRRALLEGMAVQLEAGQDRILAANASDMEHATAAGASKATLDRLMLDTARVQGMAGALREVAAQADPLGQTTRREIRPNGLVVERQPGGRVERCLHRHPRGGTCVATRVRHRQIGDEREVRHRHDPASRVATGCAVGAQLLQVHAAEVETGLLGELPFGRGVEGLVVVGQKSAG